MKRLLIISLLVLFTSCLGTKKVTENTTDTKQTEVTNQKKDSVSDTKINKEIKDVVTTPVAATGDEILDAKIDEILSKLNTQKSSGSNAYTLNYDRLKRELKAELTVGETKDTTTNTNKETTTEKTFEERTDAYIYKKVSTLPWWAWALLAFWFGPQLISRFQAIVNPLSGLLKK